MSRTPRRHRRADRRCALRSELSAGESFDPAAPEVLGRVAEIVAEAVATDDAPTLLLQVLACDGSNAFDLAVREVGDDGPYEDLAALEPAPGCVAVGIATGGRLRQMVDGGPPAAPRPLAGDVIGRAQVVQLVSVRHATVAALRRGDGEVELLGAHDAPAGGRMVDLCLRALGLTTDPAAIDTREVWADWWLRRVFFEAASDIPSPAWDAVAGMHPAALLGVASPSSSPQQLADAADRLSQQLGWASLRDLSPPHLLAAWGLTPAITNRLDDGAFSRWVLGELPPFDEIATALDDLLMPSVANAVRHVLRAAGLVAQ